MRDYVIRRLLMFVPTLLSASIVTVVLLRFVPGEIAEILVLQTGSESSNSAVLINALDARNQIVPFDPDYEELIRVLASLASVAVRNAQLEEVARGRAALRFVASLATTTPMRSILRSV